MNGWAALLIEKDNIHGFSSVPIAPEEARMDVRAQKGGIITFSLWGTLLSISSPTPHPTELLIYLHVSRDILSNRMIHQKSYMWPKGHWISSASHIHQQ